MSGYLPEMVLPDVKIPVSLLEHAAQFGGKPDHDCLRGDLVVRQGRAAHLHQSEARGPARLVLPKLTECHVHLDKCHTVFRMDGVGGDLQAAIAAQADDRKHWTEDDVRARAVRGLDELVMAGCRSVRSHVDWGTGDDSSAPSLAWPVLRELAQDYRDSITLQIAPLTGVESLANIDTARAIAREIVAGNGVLGVFVRGQPDRLNGIKQTFRVAQEFGLALDFHVDEGLGDELDGLEMIADTAIETSHQGPILCGHACSLMNLDAEALQKLAEKLAASGITIASLPSTNLYLQGRRTGTPDRRGIAPVRELRAAGVPVIVGTDNVRDAFCPLGQHDPRQSLALLALAVHLDPPFGDYLPMITTDAEKALGLAPTNIDDASVGDLIMFDAQTTADLLAGKSPPTPLSVALQGEFV